MVRTYNVGTECYAILSSVTDPEFMLPIKIVILEKHTFNERTTYKVKIKDIFETNFNLLKEHLMGMKVSCNLKTENKVQLVKKSELENMKGMGELLTVLDQKPFFIEDVFITLDKDGLYDLYNRFVKYMINYHYKRLFTLCNRSFLANQPIFENQKELFKKRVNSIGFGDVFEKYNLKLDI